MKRAKTIFLDSLWKNADFLVLLVLLQLWQFLTNTPLNLRTALTVAGLFVICSFFGAVRRIETRDSAQPAKAEKRKFVEDPEMVLELTKLTGYEAIRQLTPYLDKWIAISGRFEGIAESLQKDAIHLSLLLNDGRRINLRFAVEHGERLRALREGQRITAVGRIPCYGLVFSPENCELIRVEPLRLAFAA
jgi:hypothetical protein